MDASSNMQLTTTAIVPNITVHITAGIAAFIESSVININEPETDARQEIMLMMNTILSMSRMKSALLLCLDIS